MDTGNYFFVSAMNQAQLLKKYEGVDYTTWDIDDLANRYCKAKDDDDEEYKSYYCSALILRFWNTVSRIYRKSKTLKFTRDDCAIVAYRGIEKACRYRIWQDETKKVTAQQAIHQCINTISKQEIYDANTDKRRANFATTSFDTVISADGETSMVDLVDDEYAESMIENINKEYEAKNIIQTYIDDNLLVQAIILDTIAFNDVRQLKTKKEKYVDEEGNTQTRVKSYSEFSNRKCVNLLNNIDNDYKDYFKETYTVNPSALDSAVRVITSANNPKKYRLLNKTLTEARKKLKTVQ